MNVAINKYIPVKGWTKFKNALVQNDILTTGIDKIQTPERCHFIHPRTYTFLIKTPHSVKEINYGAFYGYLNSCNIQQAEFVKMRKIMAAIFNEHEMIK